MTDLTVTDSSTQLIHEIEMRTCNIHLGITRPSSLFGGRWIILLSFPETASWTAYYSDGSPFAENPYDWKYVNGVFRTYNLDFHYTPLLGNLEEERFRTFHEAFFDTPPGPDQVFAVRSIYALANRGLLEQRVTRRWLGRPQYSEGEKEYFYGNLCQVDYEFYRNEVVESGFHSEESDPVKSILSGRGEGKWRRND
ncbi:hypothetical protein BDV06DRAFT_226583 [Aspergillus oleicola]